MLLLQLIFCWSLSLAPIAHLLKLLLVCLSIRKGQTLQVHLVNGEKGLFNSNFHRCSAKNVTSVNINHLILLFQESKVKKCKHTVCTKKVFYIVYYLDFEIFKWLNTTDQQVDENAICFSPSFRYSPLDLIKW